MFILICKAKILFDPLYEETLNNTSELMVYLTNHIFFEIVVPLSIFAAVMLTLLVDWSWIPLSSTERLSGNSLEEFKNKLFE